MHRRTLRASRTTTAVIGPPPGEIYSETNDNSLCGDPTELQQASCLVGHAKARKEQHSDLYTRP
jgi:hypothetical protein